MKDYTAIERITNKVLYQLNSEEKPLDNDDVYYIEKVNTTYYVKAFYDPINDVFYEGSTFRELVDAKIQSKIIQNSKRRQDGIEAYEKVASEMDAYVELGIVTQAQFEYISDTMKPVRAEIVMGRWKEGLDILITLQPKLDTTTYNKFHKIITDYLAQ